MADWNALLDHLAQGPRENGTPELAATAAWLLEELKRRGVEAHAWTFTAHPWRLRALGVVALLGGAGYAGLLLKRQRLFALLVALALPALLVAEMDFGVTLAGAFHSAQQQHIIATLKPKQPATQRLLFSAHYDTKTDLLDHVVRAPITALTVPCFLLMWAAAALARPRLRTAGAAAACLNGLGLFAALTGGAAVSQRSSGAIDDGAGCAVLLELASRLELEHTEVQLLFFSAEELGLEGSRAYVGALSRDLPVNVINLDGVGAASALAVFRSEAGFTRSFPPDPKLIEVIGRVAPLHRTFYPATTDARAFLEAGIPALNLSSDLPEHAIVRGMHSKDDQRSRVDVKALDAHLEVLLEVAARLDTGAP